MADMGSAALDYAAHGLAVFPLVPRRKEPACEHGVKDATLDAAEIEKAWGDQPDMNVAIACGAASGGLMVIDIDVDDSTGKDGMEHLLAWERGHGELPETASVVTGRGGMHLYYRVDGPVKNSVNEELGIDIRGDGGYVMAPPSIHPNGRRVEWENDPEEFGIAEADANVLAFVESVRPSGFGERRKKFDIRRKHSRGGRNNALFRALCSVRSQNGDDDYVKAFATIYNKENLNPPLPDDEVEKVIESVLQFDPGNKELDDFVYGKKTIKDAGPKQPRKNNAFQHNVCARKLIEEDGACFIDGVPAIFSNGRYRMGWDAVNEAIIEYRDDVKSNARKEVQLYLVAKAPRKEAAPPNLVGFENGVLDVETMAFRPWSTDDVIPNVIPHDWDAFAEDEAVDRVMTKLAAGDPAVEMNLQEIVGLCMMRSAKYGYAPVLIGDGSNGKSTYIGMLEALLGYSNISSLDIAEIGERFQASRIAGKLANLGDDISNEFLKGSAMAVFKKVATGSRIYTDVKSSAGFEFVPYCTMVFSANEMPRMGDSGYGVMRRLFPVRFDAVFSRDDDDFDPDIGEKLATENAAKRLARLGVIGLRRVMANKAMTPNSASERSIEEIERDNDPVLLWIYEEGVTFEEIDGQPNSAVYADFSEWCRKSGAMPVKITKFSRSVCKRFDCKTVSQRRYIDRYGNVTSDGTVTKVVRCYAK